MDGLHYAAGQADSYSYLGYSSGFFYGNRRLGTSDMAYHLGRISERTFKKYSLDIVTGQALY